MPSLINSLLRGKLARRASALAWRAIAMAAMAILPGTPRVAAVGLDSPLLPTEWERQQEIAPLLVSGDWIRLRGLPEPPGADAGETAEQAAAIERLRAGGIRSVVTLGVGPFERRDTRLKRGFGVPLDLFTVFETARQWAAAYPGIAAWEAWNEPDLLFLLDNPETYAAYLKATALGVRQGAAEAAGRSADVRPPLVLMAPLGLPPGPYLERLVDNDLFAYTDGFNFHFYGYAEDLTGVYRRFETAARELAKRRPEYPPTTQERRTLRKRLPVFMTEYGYASLLEEEQHTVAARVRQWRWFRDAIGQIHRLRIEAPMAFFLAPAADESGVQFGLADVPENMSPVPTAADFGDARAAEWRAGIGAPAGKWVASPALAYLNDFSRRNRYRPREWKIAAPLPSPVVIDLVAEPSLVPAKTLGGYVVGDAGAAEMAQGRAEVRLYNFSSRPVRGVLRCNAPGVLGESVSGGEDSATERGLQLAPMTMQRVPIDLSVGRQRLVSTRLALSFETVEPEHRVATFSTQLHSDFRGMRRHVVRTLGDGEETAAHNRRFLLRRPLAREEAPLQASGRWLVTTGVTVEERGWNDGAVGASDGAGRGVARVRIAALPARAVLPLAPQKKGFGLGEPRPGRDERALPWLQFPYRAVREEGAQPTRHRFAGEGAGLMQVHLRTENGNLYQVWPQRAPSFAWKWYAEALDQFSLSFFARCEAPWRFAENRPVALEFVFWPNRLPATVEIGLPDIVVYENETAPVSR